MDIGSLGKGMSDGGGYDLEELKQASEAMKQGKDLSKDMQDVDPMYIEVIPNSILHHTEEYEARMVIVEYDANNNIIGVELL